MLHSDILNDVKYLLAHWQYNLRWVSVTEEEMVAEKWMTFSEVLKQIEQSSESVADKGFRFERLIKNYLRTTSVYSFEKSHIYLWKEWPHKDAVSASDIGIDLVIETENSEFIAVQCKFYRNKIDKDNINSFVATLGKTFLINGCRHKFSRGLLFVTQELTKNAELLINSHEPEITKITTTELDDSGVNWEELYKDRFGSAAKEKRKEIFDYQEEAIKKVHEHFKHHDRGKLIMACGTGKTFTSLHIAEKETKGKGLVLFLAPSIALVGQTLRKWMVDSSENVIIHPICVCSDASVGKAKEENDDIFDDYVSRLAQPASTNPQTTAEQIHKFVTEFPNDMTVVFSTYQSIEVIHEAQQILMKKDPEKFQFDITICDEAHRTTGAGKKESYFVRVHDSEFIHSKKRLYMTATSRLYAESVKKQAAEREIPVWSMDDESQFGEEIYRFTFGEAVKKERLSDYRVIIFALNSSNTESGILSIDDRTKIKGCIEALSKQVVTESGNLCDVEGKFCEKKEDTYCGGGEDIPCKMMKTAVAFCSSIDPITSKDGTIKNGVASKILRDQLNEYSKELDESELNRKKLVKVSARHVDGTMSASQRDADLLWLKEKFPDNECRVLTNVRCLSEGVDVPSLDAVIFLSGMSSEIDVVQAVGRVMRKSEGKQFGYIIIPTVIDPENIDKELKSGAFDTVWCVIRALKAHDERLDATINKIELNDKRPQNLTIGTSQSGILERGAIKEQLFLQFKEASDKIYAKLVEKLGTRSHWQTWAKRVADIAVEHSQRIQKLIDTDAEHKQAFDEFLNGLHRNINPSVTKETAIDMLAQHIIIKPIFEALFEGDEFSKKNPISIAMQKVLDLLDQGYEEKDKGLLRYYEYVKDQIGNIDNAAGKQKIIKELYGNFFTVAFKKLAEQLGIVYTPIEIVDFMIHSVNDILKKEFGRTLSDENVNIIDPFTGTGTFITRLLQSGLIDKKDLPRKYERELFANEIVLLAYYVASVNIESVYHDLTGNGEIFRGICLTDTFQLGERSEDELFTHKFPKNSARLEQQVKTPIHVIISNPPYSIGQKKADDNAPNMKYAKLDKRIRQTYAEKSTAILKNSLYDSYIRAFRWASDRVDPENGGIIAFITNSGWLDGNAADGLRKCLQEEFSSIYVLDLKGAAFGGVDEGESVFGIKTGVAITILVKNLHVDKRIADIFYADIGDNLKKQEKFELMNSWRSITNTKYVQIIPNKYGDWLNQRSEDFEKFIPIEPTDKFEKDNESFFLLHSSGLKTNRDAWCYNSSENELIQNIKKTINYYNNTLDQMKKILLEKSTAKLITQLNIENIKLQITKADYDPTNISWTDKTKKDFEKEIEYKFSQDSLVQSMYRPFFKQQCYFNRQLNERVCQLPKILPDRDHENLVICFPAKGEKQTSFPFITDLIPDLHIIASSQCYPLYYYQNGKKYDAITDFILSKYREIDPSISKEDIFYSVYGFLHSQEYLKKFAGDLKRSLPRLPLLSKEHFEIFSKAGRQLADLHLKYETIGAPSGVIVEGAELGHFEVEKMRFVSKGDKSAIIYNKYITIRNIPPEAYEYVLNGRSAIEWVMKQYQITIDKASQIKNDPNLWGQEHGNPRYILDVLLGVINVSIKTMEIVKGLPKQDDLY